MSVQLLQLKSIYATRVPISDSYCAVEQRNTSCKSVVGKVWAKVEFLRNGRASSEMLWEYVFSWLLPLYEPNQFLGHSRPISIRCPIISKRHHVASKFNGSILYTSWFVHMLCFQVQTVTLAITNKLSSLGFFHVPRCLYMCERILDGLLGDKNWNQ